MPCRELRIHRLVSQFLFFAPSRKGYFHLSFEGLLKQTHCGSHWLLESSTHGKQVLTWDIPWKNLRVWNVVGYPKFGKHHQWALWPDNSNIIQTTVALFSIIILVSKTTWGASSPSTHLSRTRAKTSNLSSIRQHKGTRAHQPQDWEDSSLDTSRGNREGQERVFLPSSCFSDTQSFCHNAAPNQKRTGSLCSEPPPSLRPYLVQGAFFPCTDSLLQKQPKLPVLWWMAPKYLLQSSRPLSSTSILLSTIKWILPTWATKLAGLYFSEFSTAVLPLKLECSTQSHFP